MGAEQLSRASSAPLVATAGWLVATSNDTVSVSRAPKVASRASPNAVNCLKDTESKPTLELSWARRSGTSERVEGIDQKRDARTERDAKEAHTNLDGSRSGERHAERRSRAHCGFALGIHSLNKQS